MPVGPLIAIMPGRAITRALAALPVLALMAACSDSAAPPAKAEQSSRASPDIEIGRGFDFYVLALSWSPSYCRAEGANANQQQCDEDRDLGFVVHGLWPQFETGYPEYCPTQEPDRVPSQLGRAYLDIVPSMGLIGHQWRKHGSCSGLSQKQYLDATRAARERVEMPEAFAPDKLPREIDAMEAEAVFIAANPRLTPAGVAVKCESGLLREIRICLTPSLDFRDCPEVDRKGCRQADLDVPEPD